MDAAFVNSDCSTTLYDRLIGAVTEAKQLGHRPNDGNSLSMTANYAHTRPETQTQRQQVERLWPRALELVHALCMEAKSDPL